MNGRNTVFTVIGIGCIMIAAVTAFILYVQTGRPDGVSAAQIQQDAQVTAVPEDIGATPTAPVLDQIVEVGGSLIQVQIDGAVAVQVNPDAAQQAQVQIATETPIPVADTAVPESTPLPQPEVTSFPTPTPVPVEVVVENTPVPQISPINLLVAGVEEFVYVDYVVLPEDTLYSIANKFSITTELLAVNDIASDHVIAGETLSIPQPNSARCSNGRVYLVHPEETVYSIARAHSVSSEQLRDVNVGVIGADYMVKSSVVICIP